jgi:hypothetical protein
MVSLAASSCRPDTSRGEWSGVQVWGCWVRVWVRGAVGAGKCWFGAGGRVWAERGARVWAGWLVMGWRVGLGCGGVCWSKCGVRVGTEVRMWMCKWDAASGRCRRRCIYEPLMSSRTLQAAASLHPCLLPPTLTPFIPKMCFTWLPHFLKFANPGRMQRGKVVSGAGIVKGRRVGGVGKSRCARCGGSPTHKCLGKS